MIRAERYRKLNVAGNAVASGPVVYWMSRDQRVRDNWALLFAAEKARELARPLVVVFCLRKKFAFATERMLDFMLAGLTQVEGELAERRVPFYFLLGHPETELPKFARIHEASAIVSDFSPLRHHRAWQKEGAGKVRVPFFEVDAHNIVPAWAASGKQEFGAYTIRPKLHRLLPGYLEDFPKLLLSAAQKSAVMPPKTVWKSIRSHISVDASVPVLDWIVSGERAAHKAVRQFVAGSLARYDEKRNDPTLGGQSDLSPYLHFGQMSAQRVVLEVLKQHRLHIHDVLDKAKNGAGGARGSAAAFIEELVVRRELADNFCFYNPHYDSPKGYPAWAQRTLHAHAHDKREHIYSPVEFEQSKTHDELWNAAQMELVKRGKMHGYMRMYWAKKILEWTKSVPVAHKTALYLNDKYSLDGRDPNGYVGVAWSLGGVHDRAWFERPIFGKIRFMSYGGARGKFNIADYLARVKEL